VPTESQRDVIAAIAAHADQEIARLKFELFRLGKYRETTMLDGVMALYLEFEDATRLESWSKELGELINAASPVALLESLSTACGEWEQ
jgi:hypothetical protein